MMLPSQPTAMWIDTVERGEEDDQEDWNIEYFGKTATGNVEESKNDAVKSRMSNITMVPSSGVTPAMVQTVATSETGAVHVKSGWCFVEESISTASMNLFGTSLPK